MTDVRPWTGAEQIRLSRAWGEPLPQLAQRHGRSDAAIARKAWKLGLMADHANAHLHPRVAALLTRGLDWPSIIELTGARWQTVRLVSIRLRRTGDLA